MILCLLRAVDTVPSSPEALARGRPRCLLVYTMEGGVVSSKHALSHPDLR